MGVEGGVERAPGARRADLDGGDLDDPSAKRAQRAGKSAGLRARTRNEDAASGERLRARARVHGAILAAPSFLHGDDELTERTEPRAGRRLRIAWDNSLVRRNPTGSGVYARQLVRELEKSPEIELAVFEGWQDARKAGDFGSQSVPARALRAARGMLWSHVAFPRRLRREKFDVLHSPAFILPFSCPCATIATVHDLSFVRFPEHFERRWGDYLRHVMPQVLRKASAVISVSEFTKQELLRYYEVAPEKIRVIYNGVDHGRFRAGAALDATWARQAGLRGAYILHAGVLNRRKNLPLLLRALARLRAEGKLKDMQLVLAGPELSVNVGADEVRGAIGELGLGDMVVFGGMVPDDVLPGLYANAKVLVMPSIYEGFGLPVAEAMASGTPVVASNTTSLPEVAGDAALLVPPDDEAAWAAAIAKILDEPATAAALREKGLAQARKFSWERAAAETLALYHEVAGA